MSAPKPPLHGGPVDAAGILQLVMSSSAAAAPAAQEKSSGKKSRSSAASKKAGEFEIMYVIGGDKVHAKPDGSDPVKFQVIKRGQPAAIA